MSTAEQLQLRALRILNDGRPHAKQARTWARAITNTPFPERLIADSKSRHQFTLRELSLGAQ